MKVRYYNKKASRKLLTTAVNERNEWKRKAKNFKKVLDNQKTK